MEMVKKSAVHVLGTFALIVLFVCVAAASVPYWRQMQCIWSDDEVCLSSWQEEKLHEKDKQIEDLKAKVASFEKLNTKLVEGDIDPVNIFKTYDVEGTDRKVTVGTVYEKLVGEDVTYADYYCYIEIEDDDGVASNMFIRSRGEFIEDVNYEVAGFTGAQYDVAVSLCQPLDLNETRNTGAIQ